MLNRLVIWFSYKNYVIEFYSLKYVDASHLETWYFKYMSKWKYMPMWKKTVDIKESLRKMNATDGLRKLRYPPSTFCMFTI